MELTKPNYKQTDVGLIPDDWEIKSFSEIGAFYKGKGVKKDEVQTDGVPCVRYGELYTSYNDIITETKSFISKRVASESFKLKFGDLLFAGSGETKSEIGKSAVVLRDDTYAGGDIVVHRSNGVNPIFLGYLSNADFVTKQKSFNAQGDAIVHIYRKGIGNIKLPLPPTLHEQKAIANALSDVDALISSLDVLVDKKKAVKQGVMQQLLTPPHKGGKRLPGFDGEWEEKNINELSKTFTKQTGFDYSNHIKPTLIKKKQRGHLPFIQNKDFEGHSVNFDTDYYIPQSVALRFPMILLNEKCLMISISGSIGKVGVFNNKQMAFIGGAVSVGKFHNPSYLDWVMNYLQSEAGQNMMLKDVKAGSHQNLILDDIRKMIIPMPELEEQLAINKILGDMDAEIELLETKKSKYQEIKQGMMQELLTGKTRLV
tara:strand:- start:2174 stop:3457 length:1284 start_codon:yes stop_codon:yes gene_type:complete